MACVRIQQIAVVYGNPIQESENATSYSQDPAQIGRVWKPTQEKKRVPPVYWETQYKTDKTEVK